MPTRRPALRLLQSSLAVILITGLGACARCGGAKSTRPAEELIAPDSTLVVSVPNTGVLADRLQGLVATARGGAGGDRVVQLAAALATQLGFDPLTRDGLKGAGIDADRPFAFGAPAAPKRGAFAVVPFDDRDKLEATLDRLAKDRAGAAVKEERTEDGVGVTVLTNAPAGAPIVAYAPKDGFLAIAGGPDAAALVAAATKRQAAESIAADKLFVGAKTKLGQRELYAFLPKLSSGGSGPKLPGAVALGAGVTANELALRLYVDLDEAQRTLAMNALVGGGESLLAKLPKDAPVYLRGALDWAGMVKTAEQREDVKAGLEKLRALAKEVNIDLDKELLENVQPAFAVSMGIAPTANLSTAFDFDPRRSNPFDNYTLLGVGKVKDPDRAKDTLEKIAPIIEKFGSTVSVKELAGAKVWTADYKLGQGLSWTLRGGDLIVAGGYGDGLEKAITGLEDKTKYVVPGEFAPRAREALFKREGISLAVDFARLGKTVEELPTEAFGTGPGALMARSVAGNVIQPLSRLKAVVSLAPMTGGIAVDLSVAAK